MKIKFQGKIEDNGRLTIHDHKRFLNELIILTGKDVWVSVENMTRSRSTQQNKFYWKIVVPLVRAGLIDIGYMMSVDETHELIKFKFAKREFPNELTGEVIKTVGSTTKMNTIEFSSFIEQIQQWGAEYLSIDIPSPGEALEIGFGG